MSARACVLAGVPALIATPGDDTSTHAARARPAVLWIHGFRADALAHAAELERCAALGFVAVGIDAVDHGARGGPQLSERLGRSVNGALPVMLEIVEATALELPAVIDALAVEYHVDRGCVSLVGISMGAFLAYRAITSGLPLRSVVALLGSPEWPGNTSAHRSLPSFNDVALLSITAEHDDSVPPPPVHRLHARLGEQTAPTPVQQHLVLQGAGHLTNAAQWAEAMRATMAWLERYGRSG